MIIQKNKSKTSKIAIASTLRSTTRTPKVTDTMAQDLPVDTPEGVDVADATTDTAIGSNITSRIDEANGLITSDILSYMAQHPDISYPETTSKPSVEMPPNAARRTAQDLDMNDDWVDVLFALPSNDDFFTSSLDDFCFNEIEFEEGESIL